jgi:hypothetical protein
MPTETLEKPEILAADEHSEELLQQAFSKSGLRAGRHGWRTIKRWTTLSQRGDAPLLVAWTGASIDHDKIRKLRALNRVIAAHLIFQGDLQLKAVADRITWLRVGSENRICLVDKEKEEELFLERYLSALDSGDCEGRIIDAWWEADALVVVSPRAKGFAKLRVPLDKLPVLQGHNKKALERFEVDEDGAFVYWPSLDIHLSWEQFEQAVDKKAFMKARQQSGAFNQAYGLAIRKLREKSNLRQSDIEDLTPRQVGRIERGECRATHNALSKLANAHKMSISDYMNELANLLESAGGD